MCLLNMSLSECEKPECQSYLLRHLQSKFLQPAKSRKQYKNLVEQTWTFFSSSFLSFTELTVYYTWYSINAVFSPVGDFSSQTEWQKQLPGQAIAHMWEWGLHELRRVQCPANGPGWYGPGQVVPVWNARNSNRPEESNILLSEVSPAHSNPTTLTLYFLCFNCGCYPNAYVGLNDSQCVTLHKCSKTK